MNSFKHTYKKTNHFFPQTQFIIIVTVVLVIICSTFISINAKGSDTTGSKYFTTIKIEDGDSLWSIANTYCSSGYNDYNEYIDEVKSINNMSDDVVKKGSYIVVPYYKSN